MVTAYPVAGKRKSYDICQAFLDGCGSGVVSSGAWLREGPAVFFGVDRSNESVWRDVRERGDYYYIDNAYFDSTRGTHFRVTRDRLQHSGYGRSNCARFRALGVAIKPWRARGEHVVVCPQSEQFMRVVCGLAADWTSTTMAALSHVTAREVRLRQWNRDKAALAASLGDDLRNAHALVTWSSAAAVTAILAGVPAISTGPSAARPMSGDIADIESPLMPEREEWAGVLADSQWTLDEFRAGKPWEALHG